MGFMSKKPPKAPTPANAPQLASEIATPPDFIPFGGPGSLISTGASGLKRKANTQRTSLIGG
jgi:hypothetical protein